MENDRNFELELFCAVNIIQFIFIALRLDRFITWSWVIVFIPLWIIMCLSIIGCLYALIFFLILLRSPEVGVGVLERIYPPLSSPNIKLKKLFFRPGGSPKGQSAHCHLLLAGCDSVSNLSLSAGQQAGLNESDAALDHSVQLHVQRLAKQLSTDELLHRLHPVVFCVHHFDLFVVWWQQRQ